MLLQQKSKNITISNGKSKFEFLPTGDVHQFLNGDFLINQFLGTAKEGSANNIYLRVYEDEKIKVVPLLGIKSKSDFYFSEDSVLYKGEALGVKYEVEFTLATEEVWFWDIKLSGANKEIDLIYAQDISVANKGGTVTNELYMSQYLDNKILNGENGFVICSRQNQNQGGKFPYLSQGAINGKVIGYSTDAMTFFGKEYKLTDVPVLLDKNLPNENYQFELSYTALQTDKFNLNDSIKVSFYGIFKETHENAVTEIEYLDEINAAYKKIENKENNFECSEKVKIKKSFNGTLVSEKFTDEEISKFFKIRCMEEIVDGKLLSFFTPDHEHVILQDKELLVERPSGHIITSGINTEKIDSNLITSTNYMFGVFNAQVVVGNTTLNKLMSTTRGLLNILKNTGQRIYIKDNDEFKILTLPAAYELGVNYAKWYYKFNDDVVIITSYTAKENADLILELESVNGIEYELVISNQLVMGSVEFEEPCNAVRDGNKIAITAQEGSFLANTYKNIKYDLIVKDVDFEMNDDSIFFEDEETRNGTLLTLNIKPTSKLQLIIEATLDKERNSSTMQYTLESEKAKFRDLYNELTCGFELNIKNNKSKYNLEKINEIIWWYTHNAMVHYSVPHGLEQPGGAAWGTRDVCQGPIEYFMATQKYDLSREIIKEIFSHQFMQTGEWPQWFMFDKYNMQQDDSHGDVIFWPLKVIGDYIKVTADYSILDEKAVYRSFPDGKILAEESILSHVKRAMESIDERFVHGTSLISYAGGDWDDTLQPANKELKENLVSAWTMALAYQTIKNLSEVMNNNNEKYGELLAKKAEDIKLTFNKLLIKDDVIAGFAYTEDGENIEYMLHPDDKKTGIKYRLLPMTRSIISELVNPEQAKKNMKLIDEKFKCPDGVRLMDKPARYKGGVSEIFQRAEQASNVGREVGLQYVHAHIRYIESLAKLGKAEEAWNAMYTINPINIKEIVPNAVIRQSNAYFSSSEGTFKDRYEYQDNFDKLRTGEIDVKAGWRIYSSGPGIYINQLISNVLGFRLTSENVVIDPVIPIELDGLTFKYKFEDKNLQIKYVINGNKVSEVRVNNQVLAVNNLENLYRNSGVLLNKKEFKKMLTDELNTVEVIVN